MAHWREREDAIFKILDELPTDIGENFTRIVDIGCGPGLLTNSAIKNGFSYLGTDSNKTIIKYCKEKYLFPGQATFTSSPIPSIEVSIQPSDIVILNGVMHHLNNEEVNHLLHHLSSSGLIIIADHFLDQTVGAWPKFLQRRDRGKYVREFAFFKSLTGYKTVRSLVYPIKLLSFTFWMYFCIAYMPMPNNNVEK